MPARDLSQPESSRALSSCRCLGSSARSLPAFQPVAAALFAACMLLPGTAVTAQASPAPAAVPAQKPTAAASGNHLPGAQPAPAATHTQPKPPHWPANDQPSEATVVWDSHGLRILAFNSSLAQILKDVSAETGATLEGMGQDERIFGAYGPAPARDVLTQLLDGSDYNVLMIGDEGEGTPRRIVLSARTTGPAQPAGSPSTSNDEETDAEPQQQQPQPQPAPVREAPPAGMPLRPQQMPPDIRQRQQQQQQQQNPQN